MELPDVGVSDRDFGGAAQIWEQQRVVGDTTLVLLELTVAFEERVRPPSGLDRCSLRRASFRRRAGLRTLAGLSRSLVTDSLFSRERLGSTGLGHGVAIPHGRIKGLKAPMAAVLLLDRPIGFDAPDEQAVNLLIFLLVPEAATQKHLEILSEIAELLSDASLRDKMSASSDAAQLHGLIAQWQSDLP